MGRPELAATVSAMPASATATKAVLQPFMPSASSWMISSCMQDSGDRWCWWCGVAVAVVLVLAVVTTDMLGRKCRVASVASRQ